MLIRCQGPCGEDLPEERFARLPKCRTKTCRACAGLKNRRPLTVEKKCRTCRRKTTRLCACDRMPARVEFGKGVRCACGEYRPRDFYVDRSKWDGLECTCKACTKALYKQWRKTKAGQRLVKKYQKTGRRKVWDKTFMQTENGRRLRKEANDRLKEKHPKRASALTRVRKRLLSGKLKRPSKCKFCMKESPKIWALIGDYKRPDSTLDWACPPCHRQKKKSPEVKIRESDEAREKLEDRMIEKRAQKTAARYGVDIEIARRLSQPIPEYAPAAVAAARTPPAWESLHPNDRPSSRIEGGIVRGANRGGDVERWGDTFESSLTMKEIMESPFVRAFL